MTGDYGEDRRAVREYYKDVLSNKKHHGPAMKLLKEREELLGKMREQGPRPLMEQKYADAEARVDALNKREQYREKSGTRNRDGCHGKTDAGKSFGTSGSAGAYAECRRQ